MGEANVVACDVVSIEGDSATINIEGFQHRVPGRNVRKGPAQLAIRPNAITLAPRAPASPFNGQITHAAYLGDHVEYEVKTNNGTLFVIDPAVEMPFEPLTDVAIGLKDRGIAIIGG
jgi:iron(III) transport system ATP-binding protein